MKSFSGPVLIALLSAIALLSCSTTVEVYKYQYNTTLDEVFIKQDADFNKYNSVMIDQVSVWYPDAYAPTAENAGKVEANLAKAQELFRETMANAFSGRYAVVDEPGEHVLRLHVEFVDLRAAHEKIDVPHDLSRYEFKTQPGHITMIGQLFDSLSGEQLARAADLGEQQSVGGNGLVDWDAIASDFEFWANVFSSWLDRVHGEQN
ncbi:MAG: hypothetical protein ACI9CB_001793 [Rhodothermales bacterium]|jgi:hypothetical protein